MALKYDGLFKSINFKSKEVNEKFLIENKDFEFFVASQSVNNLYNGESEFY